MTTFQGLLADEVLIPMSAAEAPDPTVMVRAANEFAHAMQTLAFYLPGEFAPEAMWSLHAHEYVTQVKQGGHAQYLANRGGDELALKCAAAGLKSMVADPHYDVFTLMQRLRSPDRRAVRKLLAQKRYRNMAAAIRDLDQQFAKVEADEPLAPRHRTWLRSLRKLKLTPDDDMRRVLQSLAEVNPLRNARREQTARLHAEHERDDPVYRAIRSLCDMAGLRFAGLGEGGQTQMRATWPEGPDKRAYGWRVDTDRGPRAALFYREGAIFKKHLAVLMEQNGALPLGSLSLSRSEFNAIVPKGRD